MILLYVLIAVFLSVFTLKVFLFVKSYDSNNGEGCRMRIGREEIFARAMVVD